MTKEEKEESGFFSRWSYRKAIEDEKSRANNKQSETRQDAGSTAPHTPAIASIDQSQSAEITSLETETNLTTDEASRDETEREANHEAAKAIDIDSLDYNSDYQTFLKKGVPDELTNKAMRKLWTSNPILANIDGLNDYDEDYGDPALNSFNSIWKVGRGFLTDEDNRETIVNAVSSLDTGPSTADKDNLEVEDITTKSPEELSEAEAPDDEIEVANSTVNLAEKSEASLPQENISDTLALELSEPEYKRVSLRKRLIEE